MKRLLSVVMVGLMAGGLMAATASMAVAGEPVTNLGHCVTGNPDLTPPGRDDGTVWLHVGKAVGKYDEDWDWTGPGAATKGLNRAFEAGGKALDHVMIAFMTCGKAQP